MTITPTGDPHCLSGDAEVAKFLEALAVDFKGERERSKVALTFATLALICTVTLILMMP